MCYTWLDENKGCKNSPSGHHWTTLSGCIFATKACIDNRKKLVKQQYLFHMSTQYGKLRPTSVIFTSYEDVENGVVWHRCGHLISSGVWGTPANFNGFHVLAALLHGTLVVGVSQTLRRWTEGATYIRQGSHHVGHWPTF